MSGQFWLVYSREHNAWWRAEAAGYTNRIEEAGRYTRADAEKHANTRNSGFRDPDNEPEVACLAPEAEEVMTDLLKALMSGKRHSSGCYHIDAEIVEQAIWNAVAKP